MKLKNLFLFSALFTAYTLCAPAAPAKCSKTNLTRCLDSVCAINSGMNKAARCQYCGASSAGTPPAQKGLTNITAGKSNKYTISDKELKSAPTDPGKRYMWATNQCIEKLPDCTADDVSDTYDTLIEQSCRAAGISMQIKATAESAASKPSKNNCTKTVTTCMELKCGASFENCGNDKDFDRIFSNCGTEATGCNEYLADLRKTFTKNRSSVFEKIENALKSLIKKYETERENRINSAREGCKNNRAYNSCIEQTCENNMPDKCENKETRETERSIAGQFCAFHKTACGTIK